MSGRVRWLERGRDTGGNVAFSDESRFTLDGPDGLSAYWSDDRRPGRYHSTRRNNGGGVMVWGCFSYNGKSELAFISGNMDSSCYCATLETTYFPFIDAHHPRGAILQQDNAPCHTSHYTKEFFSDMDVRVLQWTSRSPDINPIENVWGLMAQRGL